MKFHLLSDLHLEFCDIELPGGDVLLLAGDITVAEYLVPRRTDKEAKKLKERSEQFFFKECAKYKKVLYVMGNHEHYSGWWDDTANILGVFLNKSNVELLDKESFDLGEDTIVWGGTMWTNMFNRHPIVMMEGKRQMNDYHLVKKHFPKTYGGDYVNLEPEDTVKEFELALSKLTEFLDANKDKKVIVETHMAPSSLSSHPRFGIDNPLNFCYFSNLEDYILDHPQIKTWVHGHTHDSHDYMIGETRVLCNPRGYANRSGGQENAMFDINKFFEV